MPLAKMAMMFCRWVSLIEREVSWTINFAYSDRSSESEEIVSAILCPAIEYSRVKRVLTNLNHLLRNRVSYVVWVRNTSILTCGDGFLKFIVSKA